MHPDPEYLRFIDLCVERAQEIQRENELKVFISMCKSLDFVRVVRCRDCTYRGWSDAGGHFCARGIGLTVKPDDFCAWGKNERDVQ